MRNLETCCYDCIWEKTLEENSNTLHKGENIKETFEGFEGLFSLVIWDYMDFYCFTVLYSISL